MVLAGQPAALPVEWAVVAVPLIVSGAKALRQKSPSAENMYAEKRRGARHTA